MPVLALSPTPAPQEPLHAPSRTHRHMAGELTIRQAEASDFARGHLKALAQLTSVGDVTEEMYAAFVRGLPDTHVVLVAVDEASDTVVGSATLLIEPKLIHGGSSAGHIEDVVVLDSWRGTGLGRTLVRRLVALAAQRGCYKAFLDCASHNIQFYNKCGLEEHGAMMCVYLV